MAQYLLNPVAVFGPTVDGPLSATTIRRLNTPVNQRRAIRYIFETCDINNSGRLDFIEFKKTYDIFGRLYYNLPSLSIMQLEFQHADFVTNNGLIGIDEFAFLCDRLFLFWKKNIAAFSLPSGETWTELEQLTLASYVKRDQLGPNFPLLFDDCDWDQNDSLNYAEFVGCLQSTGTEYRVDLTWDEDHLGEYFSLLANNQNLVDRLKFMELVRPYLNHLIDYTYASMPIIEFPEEEETPEEEEQLEEEEEEEEEYYEP